MPRPAEPFTVAAVEFNPALFDFDGNLTRALEVIREAAEHGAKLIVLPEAALSGYIYRDFEQFFPYMDAVPGRATDAIAAVTAEHGCYVAIGIAEIDQATGIAYNTGALSTTRPDYESGEMTGIKRWYAENSNPEHLLGTPEEVIEGMDLFIGLSGPGVIEAKALDKMNRDAIVFAMANPNPEVMPEEAAPYVRIMATGRSDYPNQINNVLCFPGIFRGALDAGAPQITEEMKMAAARGIAGVVSDDDLSEDYIIPSVFDRDVAPMVAEAVVQEAKRAGDARFSVETGAFTELGK